MSSAMKAGSPGGPPPAPLIAGRYEPRDRIGRGAHGTVLEAFDHRIGRLVALKLLPYPVGSDGASLLTRFRQEAQTAGRLSHPGIVTVHDFGQSTDYAWIVMELVIGDTLKAVFDRQEGVALPEALRIADELLDALGAAHARGLVHRDVKPANILLAVDSGPGLGKVRLADFGLACLDEPGRGEGSTGLTGRMVGTPSAMAPEQVNGGTVDQRADLWAAGVVLYQLLTGAAPFRGNVAAVLHGILSHEPAPPSTLVPSLPPGFDAVLARALAKAPADRFADAAEMAAAIRAAATPEAAPPATGGGLFGRLRGRRG